MDEKRFCPNCDKTQPVKCEQREETLTVRDTPIKVASLVTVCSACSEVFATEAQEDENVRKAYDEYRRLKGLLSPSDLKEIRGMYGLSQTAFSRWLSWGDITIHRYEAGSLQDAAHNETLMLLKDPRNAEKILEKHRNNLDQATADRLERTIAALLNAGVAKLVESDIATSLGMAAPSELNGYRRFDIDRFENLVLHILNTVGPTFKTAINKYLWYIDFGYFREQTCSITGSQYLRFAHGPIPKSYDYLFAGMFEKGMMETEEVMFKDHSGERYSATVPANTDLFQGNELKAINAWTSYLKGRSSRRLSGMAHEEKAYMLTKDREPISYRFAAELKVRPAARKKSAAAA
ncbi:MAG: hypothetical protein CO113_10740 [Elusimicrobia bacterium CG_4_9_14_3_um_filter_62_55]|nr:MAG: hypothetical protein COR54_14065 [Elusimicrobia bacterium CG22_combo_CG10-13_8_21_14_all_63_91]PJA17234.1 MAG: hypothetical protein COX66_05265 [Elusimicrobia bacterium CG_4_10_14_0_2_um_filter_63_34]PJB25044.1 MAG: hypothetical protein CO113_10740 [Elusimicrobia bacterium CG_4_9_14_3_um_filter_62_55]